MKVITAPEVYKLQDGEVSVFLAGGITNCSNWQEKVITKLESELCGSTYDNLVIFNPRRENFPIHIPSAADEQIEWEFTQLNKMDIFSMYFCESDSDQPICMYELGRYISEMQKRFPIDWKDRIIISVENGYKRINDVLVQSSLACGKLSINTGQPQVEVLRDLHIKRIIKAYRHLKGWY